MLEKIIKSINWLEILRLIIAGIMGGVSASFAPCEEIANLMFNPSIIYCCL